MRRLQVEKKLEEDTKKYEDIVEDLKVKVAKLTAKCNDDEKNLEGKTKEADTIKKEFMQLSKMSHDNDQELQYLRKLRIELSKEREDLVNDLQGHQVEIENVYKINRELKAKIKRLEHVLYGKNIANNKWK